MSCFDLCHLERQPAVPRCHNNSITMETDVAENGVDVPKEDVIKSSENFIHFIILVVL